MYRDKSDLITWSNTFSCGIKLIDDQHRHLVNLVNEMYRHIPGNGKQELEYFVDIIQEADNYTKVHFETEEKIMKATGFPGFTEHQNEHKKFIAIVTKNFTDSAQGKRVSLCSFTKFLKEWILAHIAVMDKQYFVYLKKIATLKMDGKLSITKADIPASNRENDEALREIA